MLFASTKQSITLLVLEEMSVLWFQLPYRLVWVFWTVRWSDPVKYLETYSELLPGGEAANRRLKTFHILITSLITTNILYRQKQSSWTIQMKWWADTQ